MKPVNTILTALACVVAAVTSQAFGASCPDTSVQVRNVKLFNKCYCSTNSYQELQPVLDKHGLKLETGTGWSEKVRGKEWYYCSINLKWQDGSKRKDSKYCGEENRKRIVEEIKRAQNHPTMINSPFLSCS